MSSASGLGIDGGTRLLALIADPVRHSESPRMHNLAFAKLGLDFAYVCFEVDAPSLGHAIEGLRALKVRGWNVSMPHKRAILEHLDEYSPEVLQIGSCNTVVNDEGVLIGHNTDGLGWLAALREAHVEVAGAAVTLIGTGGAASAIAVEAAANGARAIHLFNRHDGFYEDGESLVAAINARTPGVATIRDLDDPAAVAEAIASSTILANCTNVGMHPHEGLSPLPTQCELHRELFVSDVIYAPRRSRLLEQAAAAGCRYLNGLPMMLHQGAASFRLFTGKEMPVEEVARELFS